MTSKNIEDIYPLSPVQQGMLFHSLLAPASGVYIVQVSYELHGYLDITAFEQAWQQQIDRHPVLRTAFVWENLERPLQVVGRYAKLPLEQHDWRTLSSEKQQQQLKDLLQAERKRGFNLAKAPLMRLTLIQMSQGVYQFVWSYHHLLLDGWSVPLLYKEFLAFYNAFCHEKSLHLEKPRPYRDYIAWLQQQDISKAEEFWRQTLAGFTAPTPLQGRMLEKEGRGEKEGGRRMNLMRDSDSSSPPFDFVDRSSQDQDYEEQQILLSPEITSELQSLCKKYQLTLNTLVQGTWAVILSRYSGEDDVVFGATCSGRPAALVGSEQMVGLFINTLPIRVKLSEQSLISWLKQLQAQQLDLQQYEYTPLVEIQRMSDVPKNLSLFESLVVFENYPVEPLQQAIASLDIRDVRTTEQTNYPLTIFAALPSKLSLNGQPIGNAPAARGRRKLKISISYERCRFERLAITRMLDHFQTIIESISTNPNQRLGELPLLTTSERQQLLVEWNNTQKRFEEQCFHELFEAKVEKIPDAVAVVFQDEHLTYRDLNQRSNQLAHYLQTLSVGPEVLVGICMERSLLMIVGLLGILKTGGAYVPLDPGYPHDRLAFMLLDSRVDVLLTQEKLLAALPEHKAKVVCLDRDWQTIAAQGESNPVSQITPKNLAYVIYTSGSTGVPKGVQILHSALANFLNAMRQTLGVIPEDTLLSVTTLSFDIAALELYLPLIVGAKLIVVAREVATDGLKLLEQLMESGTTVLQATPATWRLLLAVEWQGNQHIKILCGGEALDGTLAHQLLERGREVWNLYGPTETTIWSAVYKVEPGNSGSSSGVVSIGRPIANTQFYILDSHQQLVPVGVAGELHIGGEGLARGYLNQAKLTAEKFIPNFNKQSEDRLYKTGDLVCYRADGNIEYLGRIDRQVKLRGFRLELGEIEAVLNQHPAVEASAVVVQDDSDDKRLVAYVVSEEKREEDYPSAFNVNELRRFLEEKLPRYMLPSAFVMLDTLPLLPNGKVDRRSLPAADNLRPKLDVAYVVPQTDVEQTIAKIWQKALKVDKIGIHDNFFELGGHSLLVVRVHSQLRETFSSDISLVEMFSYPTISSLSEYFLAAKNRTTSIQPTDYRDSKINEGKKKLHQLRQKRVSFEKDDK